MAKVKDQTQPEHKSIVQKAIDAVDHAIHPDHAADKDKGHSKVKSTIKTHSKFSKFKQEKN